MIIKIKSSNPHLMDLLYKNPNTDFGVYAKPLKKGIVIGNIVDENNYEILFQDTKYSYLPEDSNQIDFQSYCNPLVVMDISADFFNHILKSKIEFDNKSIEWLSTTQGAIDTYACTIEIPTFYIRSGWIKDGKFLLSKYLPQIELMHSVGHNYSLKINANSIFESINLMCLVSVFAHLTNDYGVFTYVEEEFAKKYARIMTNIKGVPYFVFYLFIKRGVKNLKMFDVVKPVFEQYLFESGLKTELTYLSTHIARIEYIASNIDLNYPVLDIGCGELLYYKKFMKEGFKKSYYAIDKEERFGALAETIGQRYTTNNLFFNTDLNEFKNDEIVNILLTEVIEHNTIEEAQELLKSLLQLNFNELYITTPNSDFNKFYSEDLESRHDDHKFELSDLEFKKMMRQICSGRKDLSLRFDAIGDKINDIQTTQVCIIKKKQNDI
jgi:small RNA 2'-O-methyltransferase